MRHRYVQNRRTLTFCLSAALAAGETPNLLCSIAFGAWTAAEAVELAVGELGAAAELAQRQQGVVEDHAARAGPQPGQIGDQHGRAVVGEPATDAIGAGQDQGSRLVDRLGALRPGGALGDH